MTRRLVIPWVLWLLLVSLWAIACSDASGAEDRHHAPNRAGNEAFEKGDYKTAVEHYRKAIGFRQNDAVLWSNLGSAYTKMGNYAEALKALDRSLDIDPSLEHARYWRGWTNYYNGQYNRAIVDFDKIVNSGSFGINALRGRGWSYGRKDMHRDAIQDFTAALARDPKNEDALRGRGWAHYYSGRFREALKDFNSAIEITEAAKKGNNRDALVGKAFCYVGMDDPLSAIALIKRAKTVKDYGNWELIMVHYLSGDSRSAWKLRGGEGLLGLKVKDHSNGLFFGAEVVGMTDGSPAAQARFLEGDVITHVNGKYVSGINDLVNATNPLTPGSIAEITFHREGIERKVKVVIGSASVLITAERLAAPLLDRIKQRGEGGEVASPERHMPAAVKPDKAVKQTEGDELK